MTRPRRLYQGVLEYVWKVWGAKSLGVPTPSSIHARVTETPSAYCDNYPPAGCSAQEWHERPDVWQLVRAACPGRDRAGAKSFAQCPRSDEVAQASEVFDGSY